MYTINDNTNDVFVNEVACSFEHNEEFRNQIQNELNIDDVCSDFQIGNSYDISWAQNVRAIRLCRVQHEYNTLDYWLSKLDGRYIVCETSQDQHYSTCGRVVSNVSTIYRMALMA